MAVIISDASVLIDLAKAQLLELVLRLPYEFVVPDVMFADEVIELECYNRDTLSKLDLNQGTLDGDSINRVLGYSSRYVSLSTSESFALVLAETKPDSILLSSNQAFRRIARRHGIEAHSSLWAIDQVHQHTGAS